MSRNVAIVVIGGIAILLFVALLSMSGGMMGRMGGMMGACPM